MSEIAVRSLRIYSNNLLLLCLFLLLNLGCHVTSQLYDQEHAVLLKLKQHWRNPPSLDHWTLSSSSSHCSWPEILCSGDSITDLSLINMNITETIPPVICDLKNLTVIDLSFNYIPGTFPRSLYSCSKLEYLDLSQNYFVGPIPDDVDSLARLRYLNLCANNFSGDIPAAIGRLAELRDLRLHQNQFNGTFPPEIGNLSKLENLILAYNTKFLPSELPSDFTRLKNLKNLEMRESNLIGKLPEAMGNMSALENLDLSMNSLTGTIPSGLFMLKNLRKLYLFKNRLSGEIPGVITALNLTELDLSENNLTGELPDDIGKLEKLSALVLFSNQLSGEVPETIGSIPTLKDVRLFSNSLSGTLPPDFGRYSMLEAFEVATNRFNGRLPEHLCYGGKLQGVIAFDNNLSGELPDSLGDCNSLLIVNIENNSFTGSIPAGLWKSWNLSIVMISHNLFTGQLPDKLSGNLSKLDISNNKFFGTIPSEIGTWNNLVDFEASNNLFQGTIPRELTALTRLNTLSLDGNQLSGFIPSDIISWKSLIHLNLSGNQLSGQIPKGIGLLPGLNELDLSCNQLSGQIPPELGIPKLTSLNFSSNHLTGKIPGEFENAAFSNSFLNNPGLCASSAQVNLNSCSPSPRKPIRNSSRFLVLISCVIVAVFVLALSLSFLITRVYWKRNHGLDSMWKITSFHRVNFTLSNILSGLKENNMIGSGGSGKVYCVAVPHSGNFAVKKIWNNRKLDWKLEKEFLAEVQVLSTIRHLNIVKLMCCISDENSKLLVYEYLENRSLDQWLHKRNRPTASGSAVLGWPKRLHIAIGAAKGLSYMHHDCTPPIVHRDVKSSNILLDSEFNAKIADFGLARMLIKPGETATVSAVAGSFGYIAPEYAYSTKVNEKIDVYSFGVILLELTTGREANYGDEHTSLAEWAWRHMQVGNPIVSALDEEIKEPCYLAEMSKVFKLGIVCTSLLPSARPCMRDVVQILLGSSHTPIHRAKNDGTERDATPLP